MRLQTATAALYVCTLLALPAYAGENIVLNTTTAGNGAVPSLVQTVPSREEFCLANWPATPANGDQVFNNGFDGMQGRFFNPAVTFEISDNWAAGTIVGTAPFNIDLTAISSRQVTGRLQRDTAGTLGPPNTVYMEMWDASNGVRIYSASFTYTALNAPSTGVLFGDATAENRSLCFYRSHSTLVPLNSTPPTTFNNTARNYEWKYDLSNNTGSLVEAVAGVFNLSMSAGSPTYENTAFQNTFASLKTINVPSWANSGVVSVRAGVANQLDGSGSYSQSDTSNTATPFWQQLACPSTVKWSSRTAPIPTLTGLLFGDCTIQLTATGVNGSQGVVTAHIGAVAEDSKGVVVQADAKADAIFGPMVAYGNPANGWGWFDERAYAAAAVLQPANNAYEQAPPQWSVAGAGTVAYPLIGKGPGGAACTALSGGITATSTTISVTDATCLSLSTLPTVILIGNSVGAQEAVRVTAASATSGPANLTVAYDGRGTSAGQSNGINGVEYVSAQSWPMGTIVGEFKLTGSGSQFVTSPTSALCPVGAPGPMGTSFYTTGTVTLTGSSAVVTGIGTAWTSIFGTGAAQDAYFMRIAATHGGGTPFVWWATLVSTASDTSTTWTRPLPADVDAGPFTYVIMRQSLPVLTMTDAAGSYEIYIAGSGCESDTAAYGGVIYGFSTFTGSVNQTGQAYSYSTNNNATRAVGGAFGPNFYGTGLAQRAMYLRSGLDVVKNAANAMDDYWTRDPALCGGFGCAGSPLVIGGGLIGGFARLVLNPTSTLLHWSDFRQFMSQGSIGAAGCNDHDTRDGNYLEAWPTFGANYDPDSTFRAQWRTALQSINTRDNTCRNQGVTSYASETNSWANSFLWNTNHPAITLSSASTTGTGTAIPSNTCTGIATGTGVVVSGVSSLLALTGTFSILTTAIAVTGTQGGLPFSAKYQFTRVDATHGTLSVLWPADSGPVTWMSLATSIPGPNDMIAFGASGNDTAHLQYNFSCVFNSSTSITLSALPPAVFNSGGPFNPFVNELPLAGYGQQGYMMGIQAYRLGQAASLDSALGTSFGGNQALTGGWVRSYGWDKSGTGGTFYGRVFQYAEGIGVNVGTTDWNVPGTAYGIANGSDYDAARELNAEASVGMTACAQRGVCSKADGDQFYGALWCQTALTLPSFYCDVHSVGNDPADSNLTDPFLSIFKWTGYFFGMGMGHQWPAVRLGGVDPPIPVTLTINVHTPYSVAGADHLRCTFYFPSGAQEVVTTASLASSCAIADADTRQGTNYFYMLEYLTAGGVPLSASGMTPIVVQ